MTGEGSGGASETNIETDLTMRSNPFAVGGDKVVPPDAPHEDRTLNRARRVLPWATQSLQGGAGAESYGSREPT